MARKKAADGITLSEFRAWLQGVEEMQGPDWAPSVEQWRRIKAKFMDIVEDEIPTLTQPIQAPVYRPQLPQQMQAFQPGTMAAPSRPQPLPPGLGSGLEPTKTPDIDSSNGYTSNLV